MSNKIIAGAGNTGQFGWLSLQFKDLDIRSRVSWQRRFYPNSLDAVLTEHVLEHLTFDEAIATAKNIYEFLRPGGYWRIAVPDGFHPNTNYLDWVMPNSKGENFLALFRSGDEPNHKTLWNYLLLSSYLKQSGFKVRLLEWFDVNRVFNKNHWRETDGKIHRSYDGGKDSLVSFVIGAHYTSLIVDAVK